MREKESRRWAAFCRSGETPKAPPMIKVMSLTYWGIYANGTATLHTVCRLRLLEFPNYIFCEGILLYLQNIPFNNTNPSNTNLAVGKKSGRELCWAVTRDLKVLNRRQRR